MSRSLKFSLPNCLHNSINNRVAKYSLKELEDSRNVIQDKIFHEMESLHKRIAKNFVCS